MKIRLKVALAVIAFGLVSLASADERLFTYTHEAEVLPKGAMEFEQWATNRFGKAKGVYSRWDIREEFEAGLTDNLSGAIYINFQSKFTSLVDEDTLSATFGTDVDTEESQFEGLNLELKYRILNPNTSPVGFLIYFEPGFGANEWETELKLVASSNLGEKWVMALNYTVEPEWSATASKQSSELNLEATLGLAYKADPKFSIGLEGRNHSEWPDFDTPTGGYQEHSAWFLGPALHVAQEKWWATLTVLPQVGAWPETIKGDGRDLNGHERVETRLIAGINF
jgi:hypothetical protein